MAKEKDDIGKDALWFGIVSGILDGLFDADCVVDGFVEELEPEDIEGFFLDE